MSTRICSIDDVAPDSAIRVDVDGHRLAVVRCADDVYVIGDRCTHADISLSEGEVVCEDRTIECWKHGSLFDLETGEALTLPALKPVAVHSAVIDGDDVLVELAPELRQ